MDPLTCKIHSNTKPSFAHCSLFHLRLVNICIYYARQTCEIYQVLPYSVGFRAPVKPWYSRSKTVITKYSFVWTKGPVNIWDAVNFKSNLFAGRVNISPICLYTETGMFARIITSSCLVALRECKKCMLIIVCNAISRHLSVMDYKCCSVLQVITCTWAHYGT